MKKLTIIFCLPLFLAACQNNSSESTTTTDSTTVIESSVTAPVDNTSGMASPGDSMNAANNELSPGTGSNSSASSTNGNGSSSTSGSSNINNTTTRTTSPKDTRTTLEKTGHYNSDVSTPEPVNLDDKKLKKRRPQHTYGDTSIRAVPR